MFPFLLPPTPAPDARRGKALFHWDTNVELPIRTLREEIMAVGVRLDSPVGALVGACADVLAIAAAKLDVEGGTDLLGAHLEAFCSRVEQTYRNKRLEMQHAKRAKREGVPPRGPEAPG